MYRPTDQHTGRSRITARTTSKGGHNWQRDVMHLWQVSNLSHIGDPPEHLKEYMWVHSKCTVLKPAWTEFHPKDADCQKCMTAMLRFFRKLLYNAKFPKQHNPYRWQWRRDHYGRSKQLVTWLPPPGYQNKLLILADFWEEQGEGRTTETIRAFVSGTRIRRKRS